MTTLTYDSWLQGSAEEAGFRRLALRVEGACGVLCSLQDIFRVAWGNSADFELASLIINNIDSDPPSRISQLESFIVPSLPTLI